MNYHLPKAALATGAIAAGLLVACGGGGGGSGGGSGSLNVALTDAPACGFNEVNITVNKVRVHQSGNAGDSASGWVDIPVTPTKINLLDLTNGVMTTLGQTTLPAGRYTQLRLVLERNSGGTLANSVVPSTGGGEVALDTPSATTSGIKLNGNIEVTENNTTDIALDFDACKSIVKRGNGSFGLKPVISIIPIATSGAISGFLAPSIAASSNNAMVSAQVNGVIMRSTVPDPVSGKFTLAPITAGSYDIVVSANARASDVLTDVPVTANGTTTLSTDSAPLTLTPSNVATVSGKVTPAESGATVAATQTFSSGKKVVIKYQNADVTTGDYSMSLPTGAPRIGAYGTGTLPLTVTDESTLAGKYTMEASATGYQTQSLPADVSSGANVTGKDFALVQ